jgi:vacuolar-type H+-ATPase subunit H
MEDILAVISECEKKAEALIEKAKEEGRQIITEAENRAKEKKDEILKECNNIANKTVEDKKTLGQFETKRILAETSGKIEEIEKTAQENMNKAVAFILNLV